MPSHFSRTGISFDYPDNWTLDDEDTLAGQQSVTVYSPGGAFWTVAAHPRSADPEQLTMAAVEAMKEEYQEIEVEAVEETVADREMSGYDLSFYYLDLTNTVQVRSLQTDRATYVIFCQAEDREFDQVQMVFRAMATSLINQISDAA